MKKTNILFSLVFSVWLLSIVGFGQGVPSPFTIRLQPFITGGISSPVFMTNAKDGSNRLFVVQQGGIIKVVQPGSGTMTDFLNITSRVLSGGERGLLGLAFHPQYSTNGRFFVYYTRQTDGAIQIAEYHVSTADPNVADTTEKIIITIPHPTNANHNGGTVAFGPDGYLYAGHGDGGSGNDPPNNAQNINILLGKIIRLDINNVPVNQVPQYNIPPDNPYVGIAGLDEIFAIGVRNPYRFAFDRGGTNQLWVADVGQGAVEEVDIVTRGGNYGWRAYEGTTCTGLNPDQCTGGANPIVHAPPIFQYGHTGGRCSITGGFVYRGTQGSLPFGSYVYADYCSGEVILWNNNAQTVIDASSAANVVGFGEDEQGELYMIREGGPIYKIVRAKASADIDGDFKSDVGVFRGSNGTWYAINSSNNTIRQQQFGAVGDIATPEDLDGDNITDIGYFRPTDGTWNYFRSTNNTIAFYQWGTTGDLPVPSDYDGDAKADIAVFRPSNGVWYILRSSDAGFTSAIFGQAGDRPVPGDYDGDGRSDIALFRNSNGTWYRQNSSNGAFLTTLWGLTGDAPAQGDYNGDGKLDLAVFRPSTGVWYILNSGTGTVQALQWGTNNDVPVVGDYDGDGKDDVGVFRPSNGNWYLLRSTSGFSALTWGQSGDSPVAAFDNP